MDISFLINNFKEAFLSDSEVEKVLAGYKRIDLKKMTLS